LCAHLLRTARRVSAIPKPVALHRTLFPVESNVCTGPLRIQPAMIRPSRLRTCAAGFEALATKFRPGSRCLHQHWHRHPGQANQTMKSSDAIQALGALASESRLAVFRLLVKRGPQGYTPSELIERLDFAAPTLSFHLKELMHAGLVVNRRKGRNLHYSPSMDKMNDLVGFLTENCCSLADEACDANCKPVAQAPSRKRA
jgi:ArsR family transcriptional regulator, arsenate/arsenite/antimonite-responsive transcriptional repressor